MNNYDPMPGERVQNYVNQTSGLGRDELKRRIRTFRGRFKLDFTEDYLNKISVDRLRHILLAVLVNTGPKRLEDKTK